MISVRREECHTEYKLTDGQDSDSQEDETMPPSDSQFRPLNATVVSCQGSRQIQRVITDREVGSGLSESKSHESTQT